MDELTVYVDLPDGIKAKDLDIQIKQSTLKVAVKGKPPIIEGEMHKKVKVDDCMWNIESDGTKRLLNLTLQKMEGQYWWHCVMVGDTEIDT